MSISIGPNPVLDDLILWYDAANTKCYSGEPTRNQISQDYRGESGLATGNASIDLSGLFGFGLISKEPFAHEVWSLDNINKGKLTRYNSFYFDGINDYLEVADDDAFTFGQDNVSVYTQDTTPSGEWNSVRGTDTDEAGPIGGVADVLKYAIDATSGNHQINQSLMTVGKWYRVSGFAYIPSGQSNLDGFRVGTGTSTTLFANETAPTTDAWVEFSGEGVADDTLLRIYVQDGGNITFQDAGGDDVIYFHSITVTEIKDDLPFSISAWVKANDYTDAPIASKYGGISNAEWVFYGNGTDYFALYLIGPGSVYQVARTDSTITSYEGEWIHLCATYAGSGPSAASGVSFSNANQAVELYINGVLQPKGTPITSGTYEGMANTTNTLRFGRYSSSYFNGHIRNVKIFNRELNAGEVYQLYYSNRLNGVKYSSDFSSGVDGFTGDVRLTSAGNIDSIDGKNDNLRLTVTDTTSSTHYTTRNASFSSGKRTRFSAEIYIPSSNSNVDGVRIGDTTNNALFINEASPSLDTWVSVSGEATTNNQTLIIALTDGGSITFQDAGGDDVFYIRNINIVELDTNSEVDFVEEWGEANGGTYTQDATPSGNWTGINGTDADEAGPIGGVTDVLKFTVDTSLSNHSIALTTLTSGKRYRVSGSAYVPSSNSNLDGFRIGTSASTTLFRNETSPTQDTWVTFSGEGVANNSTLRIYVQDGGVVSFQDAGGDDVIYFHNITVTQIGTISDFDLSNYDDNDKITDKSPNKFIATPQGGALARDRWTPYNLAFGKDKDNNDIATITRDPSSGAFFENTDKLTFYGEHPLYVSNASTGDKVSVSFEAKSNITGLFTGLNFFNSGTSAAERVWLNRILMPDDYEYYYGTSNLIATGDNVGFTVLMNRNFSSGWNSISLRKPQIELKDHSTNFVATSRSGVNAIVNLANRNLYTGTITNDVKSSGISKLDGVQSFYPLNGGYWEFNGIDTNIDTNLTFSEDFKQFTMEACVEKHSTPSNIDIFMGVNIRPFFSILSSDVFYFSYYDKNDAITNVAGTTTLSNFTKYHAAISFDEINKTGTMYLNGQFEKGFSINGFTKDLADIFIGDRISSSVFPFDGKVYFARFYNKALTSGEVHRNYRAVKTKYGL